MIIAVALARYTLQQSSPTDEELTEAAYTVSHILRALAAADEGDTEAPTEPAVSAPAESDPPATTAPEGNVTDEATLPAETDAPSKKGCRSSLGLGAVTIAATAAAVLKKKKEE